jgi:hypothetical protein
MQTFTTVIMNETGTEMWADGRPKAIAWSLHGHWSPEAVIRRAARSGYTVARITHSVIAGKGRDGHDGEWRVVDGKPVKIAAWQEGDTVKAA